MVPVRAVHWPCGRCGAMQDGRRTACVLLSLSVLLWSCDAVLAGDGVWTSTGPEGGDVRALAIAPSDPQVVYAGTFGAGLFVSTNGADSWQDRNTGLATTIVYAVAVHILDPRIVYVSTPREGVL
jgi:hypothetical protein